MPVVVTVAIAVAIAIAVAVKMAVAIAVDAFWCVCRNLERIGMMECKHGWRIKNVGLSASCITESPDVADQLKIRLNWLELPQTALDSAYDTESFLAAQSSPTSKLACNKAVPLSEIFVIITNTLQILTRDSRSKTDHQS